MPKLKLTIKHDLQQDEAKKRMQQAFSKMLDTNAENITNVTHNWQANTATFSFDVKGFSLTGGVQVEAKTVQLHCVVPLLAMIFKSKIEELLRKGLTDLLSG